MTDPYRQHTEQYGRPQSTGSQSNNQYSQYQAFPQQYDTPSTSYQNQGYQQGYGRQAPYAAQQDHFGGQQRGYYSQPEQRPLQGHGHDGAAQQSYGQTYDQGQGYGGNALPDAFVSEFATGVLRQQGENYFQRGQAYMQSKMGFLSSQNLQYHFNIDTAYVREKLGMLLFFFLRRWTFRRKPEQISGGHKYQPPRMDAYAPDLYIPFMAACTYVVVVSIAQAAAGKFGHENVYITVSGTFTAWLLHWFVIKIALYLLGAPSLVPSLEILALAGYAFVYACLSTAIGAFGGVWVCRAVMIYGGIALATHIIQAVKHAYFQSPHSGPRARLNYSMLGLALFQFPLQWWLHIRL